ACHDRCAKSCGEKQNPGCKKQQYPVVVPNQPIVEGVALQVPRVAIDNPVALEGIISNQQPADMAPEEPKQRAVRVVRSVRVVMMLAMDRDPEGRRLLAAATSQNCDGAFDPSRTGKAAVREQPVVAD